MSVIWLFSKLTESLVVTELRDHNESNRLISRHASLYRKYHSTETALLRVQSDMFESMESQNVTLPVPLDPSAAFDTVSHNVRFPALYDQFGISGAVLKRLDFFSWTVDVRFT